MLGKKTGQTRLFYGFSLEKVVPEDDFYRKLEKAVDFSWVRGKVAHCYSDVGRPSIDPEVIIKIELVGYLEGITSERRLMREITDRLSLRRYIGYDIDEELPDHSTLSRARDLWGKELFQEVFDFSVRKCQSAGMVGGVLITGDRTLIKANASMEELERRIVHHSAEEFVERLFAENAVLEGELQDSGELVSLTERPDYPRQLKADSETTFVRGEGNCSHTTGRGPNNEDEGGGKGKRGKDKAKGKKKPVVSNATHVSRTDPDATIVARRGKGVMLGYSGEMWIDSRAGVVTHADAVRGSVAERETVIGAIRRQREVLGLRVPTLAADKGYGFGRLYWQLDREGVRAYIPHREQANPMRREYRVENFSYDGNRGVYHCPAGCELTYSGVVVSWPYASAVWKAKGSDCQDCKLRAKCTSDVSGRQLGINIFQCYCDEMDKRLGAVGARLTAIARRTGPEPHFGDGKQWQGLDRAKYRGLSKVQGQVLLTAAAQNLKKYVKWIWRKGYGVGRAATTKTQEALCFSLSHHQPMCLSPIS